jgi:hypothetical protein
MGCDKIGHVAVTCSCGAGGHVTVHLLDMWRMTPAGNAALISVDM